MYMSFYRFLGMDAQRERELFGPSVDDVLNQQHTHRSRLSYILGDHDDTLLKVYQGSGNIFWTTRTEQDEDDVVLHARVLGRLELMGFYGPARCGYYRLDRHLITALVERWRPETHTFHFPVGEVTITLQDVAIIWGLSVEGHPVICAKPKRTKSEWRTYCNLMLGFHPAEAEMRSTASILMSALRERMLHMPAIHDQSPQEDVDKYARGYALLLLGGLMMPDTSRCAVSLIYLTFLEDVTTAGAYSWGSAVLARLYRELCTASQSGAKSIAGAMSLLQIWAWSRITTLQPINIRPMLRSGDGFGVQDRDLGLPPYGARWIQHHDYTQNTSHTVRVFRDMLDRLMPGQFIWVPYDLASPDIAGLGDRRLTQNWMSQCPLINIDIVEIHHPNRGGSTMAPGYMQWYNRITRRLISPDQYIADFPGGSCRSEDLKILLKNSECSSRLTAVWLVFHAQLPAMLNKMYGDLDEIYGELKEVLSGLACKVENL
ncbi:hypothetical protein ACS0TY_035955 [Phlomoides rotata]